MKTKNTEECNGKPISEQGLCGIYAVALVTNKTVQSVFNKYKRYYQMGNDWKGSTKYGHLFNLLMLYKRKIRLIIAPKTEFSKGSGKPVSLRKFVDEYSGKNRTYIIRYRGHVMVVLNRICYDQSGETPYESIGKRDIIERVSCWSGNTYKQYFGGQKNGLVINAIEITNSLFKPPINNN